MGLIFYIDLFTFQRHCFLVYIVISNILSLFKKIFIAWSTCCINFIISHGNINSGQFYNIQNSPITVNHFSIYIFNTREFGRKKHLR